MIEEFQVPGLCYEGRFHDEPAIVNGGGPERVVDERPPKNWTPLPFLGFGAHEGDE